MKQVCLSWFPLLIYMHSNILEVNTTIADTLNMASRVCRNSNAIKRYQTISFCYLAYLLIILPWLIWLEKSTQLWLSWLLFRVENGATMKSSPFILVLGYCVLRFQNFGISFHQWYTFVILKNLVVGSFFSFCSWWVQCVGLHRNAVSENH